MTSTLLFALLACNSDPVPTDPGAQPVATPADPATAAALAEAKTFASEANAKLLELWTASETAHWAHDTNLTDENEAAASAADELVMAYLSETIPKVAKFDGLAHDADTARMLHLLKIATVLPAPSDAAKRTELAGLATKLGGVYGKGKWCQTNKKGVESCLDVGEITAALQKGAEANTDPAKQLALWEGWHTVSVPMRSDYQRFVELGNEGAGQIGLSDVGQLWKSGYDMPPAEIEKEVDRLWGQLKPLYEQLHCHVRAKLTEKYGPEIVPPNGPLPAHLMGNLWAQDWSAVYPLVEPHPGQPSLDVTKALVDKGWDDQKMTKTAEAFFVSLGLDPLPQTFWERSMFVQPTDREAVCHASAWDPSWNGDLRIKMCIKPNRDDLVTLHHELGHLYYFHYYKDLPPLFRNGANDGFHEAIGDTIALSITPQYLQQIGLFDAAAETPQAVVNQQMATALERLAFLPFGLLVDKWRWEVFDGRIPADKYNEGWWRLRRDIQGVAPASVRDESFFDAGAKFHVPNNTPYLRYFLAHVLEFQFHRALCETAGHKGPLHTCSIYGNQAAGDKLEAVLRMGSSKPWPDALEAATGQRTMDASALVQYFEPLMGYLSEQNKGRTCGW